MAKPALTPIDSSSQNNWDAILNDNFVKLTGAPFPMHRYTGGDEVALESAFPAAAHEDCLVWITHSTAGNTLMASDGTSWEIGFSI